MGTRSAFLRFISLCTVSALPVVAPQLGAVEAATVQGTFTYGGGNVLNSFPALSSSLAWAQRYGTEEWTYGTVDLAAGTFRVDGLEAGTYYLGVQLGSATSLIPGQPHAAELFDNVKVTLAAGETADRTLELKVGLHYTQPYDAFTNLPGAQGSCPFGPPAPGTVELSWEPVPLAASYLVVVKRLDCARNPLATDTSTVFGTTATVSQGVAAGEESIEIEVTALDSLTLSLSVKPYLNYEDGESNGYYLHLGGAPGRPLHPASSWFIIQAAHAAGVPPSFWMTDLILTNPTTSDITATIRYTPRGADGTQSWVERTVLVPRGASTVYSDVVSTLLGTSGAGSIEVAGSIALEVMSRTYTPGAAGGTYGQGYPAVGPESVASATGTHTRLGAGGVSGGDFRTNLSLAETWGGPADVLVTLRDGAGSVLGTETYAVAPFSSIQVNDLVGKLGGPASLVGGQVEVEVTGGNGRVAGTLSVADQTTDDPTTIPLIPR